MISLYSDSYDVGLQRANSYFTMGFPGGSVVKNPPAKQEIRVRSLSWEDTLEKVLTINEGAIGKVIKSRVLWRSSGGD